MTALCAVFVALGWMAQRGGASKAVSVVLFLGGYLLGGYRQAADGMRTLVRERALDVDLLMVVAAIGAAAIGYWEDGALLIFIFSLSGTLEGVASARTKKDIAALLGLAPDQATVVRGGNEVHIAAADVVRTALKPQGSRSILVSVASTFADAYYALGEVHEQFHEVSQARTWYERSQAVWQDLERSGRILPVDSAKPIAADRAVERLGHKQ